ncbi:type IV secretion system protein [Paraburkholderia aromaticivorans]|uniref:type IV secretion system protein n=1 Tax=Paraburkholderia aromaticivorans TaxID=2026199 RepID=UPI0014562209|nr:type IV secretion system protein [Paraburkholderia aromaticivorans]
MPNVTKFLYGVGVAFIMALVLSSFVHAQAGDVSDVDPNTGVPVDTESPGVTTAATTVISAALGSDVSGEGLAATAADITNAFNKVSALVTQITGSIIGAATSAAQTLNSESDKLAGGLAVIVVVLTFVEFAGTHHPVSAWVKAFQNLLVLGMFATVYVGYGTAAPGFCNWFLTLAKNLNGGSTPVQAIGKAAGSVWLGIVHSADGASFSQCVQIFAIDLLALLCLLAICISGVIFLYYTMVGAVQSGVGIVFGKIAIALGFHDMTRGFFSSWLAFMVHAGMYTAVAGAMNTLVISQFLAPLQTASGTLNFSTSFASVISVTISSIFIMLLSLEIPKIAGMFGSGGVSGGPGIAGKLVAAATAGAFGASRRGDEDRPKDDDEKSDDDADGSSDQKPV